MFDFGTMNFVLETNVGRDLMFLGVANCSRFAVGAAEVTYRPCGAFPPGLTVTTPKRLQLFLATSTV